MDKIILLPSVSLGGILIVIYIFRCWRMGRTPDLQVMVNAVLGASGIVGGLLLIGSPIVEYLKDKLSDLDLYIFIAGVAVLYASAKTIHRDVFK